MSDKILEEYVAMLAAAVVPDYFLPEQFCNNGNATTDYVIPPKASADPAAASLDTGAPPLQQIKPSLGGAFFPRAQYNGILRLISNIIAYLNKGNNFTFDTKNTDGYAIGAVLYDYNSSRWVESLKAANKNNFVTNPNLIDGINWRFITVNPYALNNFMVSPNVPTPSANDNSLKAINSQYFSENAAGATKYNYPISCKNTPTFQAGEEYILSLNTPFVGTGEYELLFRCANYPSASGIGDIVIKFAVTYEPTPVYNLQRIVINNIFATTGISFTQNQLNELFTFTAYNITTPVTINGVSVSGFVLTIKLNASIPTSNTVKSLTGLFSTVNVANYTGAVNPANNALLGITNGALTLAAEGVIDEEGLQASTVITPSYMVGTNVPNMTNNNLVKWLNGGVQDSGIASNNIGLLSGNNSWTGLNSFNNDINVSGYSSIGGISSTNSVSNSFSQIRVNKPNSWYSRLLLQGTSGTTPTYSELYVRNWNETITGGVSIGSDSQGTGTYTSVQNKQGDGLGILEMYSDINSNPGYQLVNISSRSFADISTSSGITMRRGYRPVLMNYGTLNKSDESSIATLRDIFDNGGGIVSRGSNVSGSWFRFANGLILCLSPSVTVGNGAYYYFPQSIQTMLYISAQPIAIIDGQAYETTIRRDTLSMSSVRIDAFTISAASTSIPAYVIAIGY